jgi:hypothetical protein
MESESLFYEMASDSIALVLLHQPIFISVESN